MVAGRNRIGSGVVVTLGIVGLTVALITLGLNVGWEAAWRALGVTPLQPPFFDMHVINDYAACAAKGVETHRLTDSSDGPRAISSQMGAR
jgi:hypothetical protein